MEENVKPKKPTVFIIISLLFSVAILIVSYFYLRYVFHNDHDAEKANYVEQGIVILVAVLSACISFISNRISSYNSDKDKFEQIERDKILRKELFDHEEAVRKKQVEFEDKWNKQKIDADLKAKARIEWIQNVRLSTSKFLSSCFNLIKLLNENEEAEINKSIIVAKETGLLLILYYGPDKDATIISEEDKLSLNFGKNNEICDIIKTILHIIESIFPKKSKEKHLSTIQSFKEQIKELEDSIPYIEIDRHISQEDVDVWIKENVIDEDSKEYDEFVSVKYDYHKYISLYSIEKLNKLISELIEKTRIYLKNEWDRAKKGE